MTARIMRLLLLFSGLVLSLSLAAQYPSNPAKSRLGYQTTGDGLTYRGSGAPSFSPGTIMNAWMYLDTTNMILYGYKNFAWVRLPLANNGITMSGAYAQLGGSLIQNTTVESGTYNLKLGKTSGTNYAYMNSYGSGQYVGMYSVFGSNETDFGLGGGGFSMNSVNSTETHTLSLDPTGFDFTYIGGSGASRLRMDSSDFTIIGLDSYSSHSAANAAKSDNKLYLLNDSRHVYIKSGTGSADILGSGTTNRIPIWTATNILGSSNALYNSTTKRWTWDSPSVIELPMGTDAQRPSPATTSDFWYNTTGNGLEWYNGTRWAKSLESTANIFTQNRVIYIDANGQATTNAAFNFNGTQLILTPSTAVAKKLQINSTATPNATGIDIDLGGKFSGNARSVPKIAIYNDGTFQWGIGAFNNGMNYIVDHPTLGHHFYAGADSILKFSITRDLNYFPTHTAGVRFTAGTTTSPTYQAAISVESSSSGINSGIAIKNTNTGNSGYASVFLESADGGASQFFSTNSTYTGYRSIVASSFGHFSNATNGMAIQLDGASAVLRVGIGVNEITRTTPAGFGIFNTSPQRALHVTGETRITDLITDTPTRFVGADSDGDLGEILFNSVWRDYQTDKAILGADSSFVHDPSVDSTYIKGNAKIQSGNLTIEKASGSPRLSIQGLATSGNQEAAIYFKSRGSFSPVIEIDANSGAVAAAKHLAFYNYNTSRGGQIVFDIGNEHGQWGARAYGKFSLYDSLGVLNFNFYNDKTAQFYGYGVGTKEASDLSKTESVYTAIYATDGTILEKRANTEQYNNITSTTSPITLSSTIADNLINQGGTQAAFTFRLPASPVDGQVCMITYNNAITTLTIDGNGNTIVGSAVTTAVAGSQRKFKFYSGVGWIKQY